MVSITLTLSVGVAQRGLDICFTNAVNKVNLLRVWFLIFFVNKQNRASNNLKRVLSK